MQNFLVGFPPLLGRISEVRCNRVPTDLSAHREENPDHSLHRAKLGYIGCPPEESTQPDLDSSLVSYAKLITRLLADGSLKPNATEIVTGGFDAVAGAVEKQLQGAGGKKVVVELQSVE